MKKIFAIVAVLSALSLLFAGCTASNSVAAIKSKNELVVATNAEFPPFEFKDGDNFVGVDMEIAQAIADKMGVKLKIDDMSFDSVLAAVPSGKADLGIAALGKDAERDKVMDFSDTYFNSSVMMLVLKDNDAIKTKDDLAGKKIGVQLGTMADTFATGVQGAEVVRMSKDADSVVDLINGKLDVVLLDSSPAKVFAQQNADKIKLLDEPLTNDQYAIAAKEGNKELLDVVNQVIKEMKDSGAYDKLLEKYDCKIQ